MAEVCARCMEDFPLAAPRESIRMGILFPIERIAPAIRHRAGVSPGFLICGNCVFDIEDDLDDENA